MNSTQQHNPATLRFHSMREVYTRETNPFRGFCQQTQKLAPSFSGSRDYSVTIKGCLVLPLYRLSGRNYNNSCSSSLFPIRCGQSIKVSTGESEATFSKLCLDSRQRRRHHRPTTSNLLLADLHNILKTLCLRSAKSA